MGDNYGPMLVGPQSFSREEIRNRKIAVPGLMTSAFLALQLFLGLPKEKLNYIVVPFDQIFDALARGEAEVGLIIHEGPAHLCRRGTRPQRRPRPVVERGDRRTAPAPRRQRGEKIARAESHRRALRHSARQHQVRSGPPRRGRRARAAARPRTRQRARGQIIGMYVNELTLDYGERGRKGVREFLDRAHHAGLIPERWRSSSSDSARSSRFPPLRWLLPSAATLQLSVSLCLPIRVA